MVEIGTFERTAQRTKPTGDATRLLEQLQPRGGVRSFSYLDTATANRVEPTEYLTDILPRVHDGLTDAELDALTPRCQIAGNRQGLRPEHTRARQATTRSVRRLQTLRCRGRPPHHGPIPAARDGLS